MRIPHQSLDGSKIIPIIQKGGGKGLPHDVGMDSLLNQSLFRRRFDETIDGLRGKRFSLIGDVLT